MDGGCGFDCGVSTGVLGVDGNGGGGTVIFGLGGGTAEVSTAGWSRGGAAVGVDGGIDRGDGVCDVFGAARKGLAPVGNPSTGI